MIYLAADIHGHIRLPELRSNINKRNISDDDYLIILGDAGIIWDEIGCREVEEFYNQLAFRTLFIDGNHENFTLLSKYPTTKMFGGSVRRISDNIIHLCRGETFEIEGKKLFVFGGGFSSKKLSNASPIFVWDEEMPNETDYNNGLTNLKKSHNSVDYILTHEAPTKIVNSMAIKVYDEELPLTDYLQCVSENVFFKKWYFGHFHKDWSKGKYRCLYNSMIELGD